MYRPFYRQTSLNTGTHRHFPTQTFCHTQTLIHRHSCTQTRLPETLLHKDPCRKFLHRNALYREALTRKGLPHRPINTQILLHTEYTFTHRQNYA